MTSNDFEVLAKTHTAKIMKEQYGIEVPINSIEMVWFAHELGYKKCTLYEQCA